MKKLLFVIYSMKFGGAERSLVNLLQELPEDKYEIDLMLFRQTGEFLTQLPPWVKLADTPPGMDKLYAPLRETGLGGFSKLWGTALSRLVRRTRKSRAAWRWKNVYRGKIEKLEKKYDLAVAYAGSENLYFVNDKVRADRKLVWIHNDYVTAKYSKEDDDEYFANMDGIVSVSEECAAVLKREFPHYSEKIHFIENITSSQVVRSQAELSRPEEFDGGQYKLLTVGRLHPQKGFDMALEAAALLKEQGFPFKWFVIGEGPLKAELSEKIKELQLEDFFVLLGTRLNPYPYIKNCDMLIQSSRYEGKSVVLDEAKILGTPIIATAYPTVRDQIKDGDEGLVVPMSAEGIRDNIMRLAEDRVLQTHIREYLQANEYGNVQEAEKYMALFDRD